MSIAILLIPLGLVWRMAPLHLPFFLYKYGGSVLWAAMIYFGLTAILRHLEPLRVGLVAEVVVVAVEVSRLVHTGGLDAFRVTLAGQLLLGRVFSGWDIVAYTLAVGVAAGVDSAVLWRWKAGR